jgi:hypothetical protein
VAAIMRTQTIQLLGTEFRSIVEADAIQFKNQYPEFQADSFGEMRIALTALQQDGTLEQEYQRFVDELVFGEPMLFEDAKQLFITAAQQILDQIHNR